MKAKITLPFIAIVILLLIVPHIYDRYKVGQKIHQDIDASQRQLEKNKRYRMNQSGYVKDIETSSILSEKMINDKLKKMAPKSRGFCQVWRYDKKKEMTISAQGLDNMHHFANSYLIGFQPFKTDQLWVPLYALATKKRYQQDHLQYSGLEDIW